MSFAVCNQRRNTFSETTFGSEKEKESAMDGIIYLVGLIVIIMAVLSVLGLR